MSAVGFVKSGLRSSLYRCGALGCWHYWRNRHALTVLMFHRVLPPDDPAFALADREFTITVDGFRRILDFVQRHYHVVSLADLQAAREGRAPLPRTPLLITFDDGWRDTLAHALPELERRDLTAVLFVPSEVVTLDDTRWWQDALVALLSQPGAPARLCAAAGWTKMPPAGAHHALAAYVGAMSPAKRREWIDRQAEGVLSQVASRQMTSIDDLRAANERVLAIGGHGHTHSPLTLVPDPKAELQASKELLSQLGQKVYSMSFPHGAWSAPLVEEAKAVGFEWIFTSQSTLTDVARGPQQPGPLGRIHVPEGTWTCTGGHIDPARLATFLFFRSITQGTGEHP